MVAALVGHSAEVSAVAWAPGGARLASCSLDGTVRVWGAPGLAGGAAPERTFWLALPWSAASAAPRRAVALRWAPRGDLIAAGVLAPAGALEVC